MRKIWISSVALLLLLTLAVTPVMADVHPSQMGDPGGRNINNIISSLPQYQNPTSQYVPTGNGEDTGSYLPNGNEDLPGQFAGDIPSDVEADWTNDIPWINNEGGNNNAGSGITTLPGDVTGLPEVPATDPNTPAVTTPSSGVQTLDWFGVGYNLINKNKNVKIYDINTGVTWSARYINGKNHADVIPASKSDADKLSKNNITGSYVRRPVVVTINGTQYAGSMYAVGHGDTSYCDYFTGVMCIHFTGSQTHGSKKVDSDHQNAINQAMKYGN